MSSTPIFIMQTCSGREHYVGENASKIPGLIINKDDFTDDNEFITTAWKNYLRGWQIAGDSPTVQMDDDIILCDRFYEHCISIITERPQDVIQFFSMRKDDLIKGSRYEPGYKFLMQQCYYLPAGMAGELYRFAKEYENSMTERGCPTDIAMQQFFKTHKIKYWNVVPNLVDHRIGKSAINPTRSSKRISLTFSKSRKCHLSL